MTEKKQRISQAIRKANAHSRFKDVELDGSNIDKVFNDNYQQWINSKSGVIDRRQLTMSDFVNDEKVLLNYYPVPETTSIDRKQYLLYVDYLNGKLNPETKTELHQSIFKGNSFQTWDEMFKQFNIKDSSKADASFMVKVMRKKDMINDVTNKVILDWISEIYGVTLNRIVDVDLRKPVNLKRMNTFDLCRGL